METRCWPTIQPKSLQESISQIEKNLYSLSYQNWEDLRQVVADMRAESFLTTSQTRMLKDLVKKLENYFKCQFDNDLECRKDELKTFLNTYFLTSDDNIVEFACEGNY